MSIFTVSIPGVSPDPEVYLDLAGAISYVSGTFGPAADAWLALPPKQQAQTLVTATRYMEQQPWDGTRTGLAGGVPTSLAWPRSGVTLGVEPVDATMVPSEFRSAVAELAMLVAKDPALTGKADQGSNIQSVNAGGGTGVTFFAPTSVRSGTATVMPIVVQRLVGKYLARPAGSIEGGFGAVGKRESSFARHRQFTLTRGEE